MSNFSEDPDYGAKFSCGPHSSEHVIDYLWRNNTPEAVREIFTFVISPVFLVVLVVVMGLVLIYYRQIIKSAISDLRTIHQELEDEHHDKLKLLSNADIVSDGML